MINGQIKAELLPLQNTDVSIVNVAKVSFNKLADVFIGGNHKGSHTRLVRYLAEHNHFTCFTHARETFAIANSSINWLELSETDLAGVVIEKRNHYELKVRMSLWQYKNWTDNNLFGNEPLCDSISYNLNNLYPNVWRELSDNHAALDCGCALHLSQDKETNPNFIDESFRFTLPFPIARQEFKHIVMATRNEVSRRYVDDKPSIFSVTEFRSRPEESIKQGSGEVHPESEEFIKMYEDSCLLALSTYGTMIKRGVAPEQARMVLPQGAMTEYIVTGSLTMFKRLYNLRIDGHAQKEIQELAKQVDIQLTEKHGEWNK